MIKFLSKDKSEDLGKLILPIPKGFYYSKIQPGKKYQALTVSQLLKTLKGDTGCGPEGIQFLTVTHPHFV